MREKNIPAVQARTVIEEIHAYTVNHEAKSITVAVGVGISGADGEVLFHRGQCYDTITIDTENYAALMSADGGPEKPIAGKPPGTFRKDDLWHFIDKVREGKDHGR